MDRLVKVELGQPDRFVLKSKNVQIPEMIRPLDGDQSTHKINASWARH
jgi:hypothetical protein